MAIKENKKKIKYYKTLTPSEMSLYFIDWAGVLFDFGTEIFNISEGKKTLEIAYKQSIELDTSTGYFEFKHNALLELGTAGLEKFTHIKKKLKNMLKYFLQQKIKKSKKMIFAKI